MFIVVKNIHIHPHISSHKLKKKEEEKKKQQTTNKQAKEKKSMDDTFSLASTSNSLLTKKVIKGLKNKKNIYIEKDEIAFQPKRQRTLSEAGANIWLRSKKTNDPINPTKKIIHNIFRDPEKVEDPVSTVVSINTSDATGILNLRQTSDVEERDILVIKDNTAQENDMVRIDHDGTLRLEGDIIVGGNLTTSTFTTEETIAITDKWLVIASGRVSAGNTPDDNAGIEIDRGTTGNMYLFFNEVDDEFCVGASKTGPGNPIALLEDTLTPADDGRILFLTNNGTITNLDGFTMGTYVHPGGGDPVDQPQLNLPALTQIQIANGIFIDYEDNISNVAQLTAEKLVATQQILAGKIEILPTGYIITKNPDPPNEALPTNLQILTNTIHGRVLIHSAGEDIALAAPLAKLHVRHLGIGNSFRVDKTNSVQFVVSNGGNVAIGSEVTTFDRLFIKGGQIVMQDTGTRIYLQCAASETTNNVSYGSSSICVDARDVGFGQLLFLHTTEALGPRRYNVSVNSVNEFVIRTDTNSDASTGIASSGGTNIFRFVPTTNSKILSVCEDQMSSPTDYTQFIIGSSTRSGHANAPRFVVASGLNSEFGGDVLITGTNRMTTGHATVNNDLSVTGNTSITGTLGITGATTVGTLNSTTINNGTVKITTGKIETTSGGLLIDVPDSPTQETVTIGGKLSVSNTSSFAGQITASGGLTTASDISVTGSGSITTPQLTIDGTFRLDNNQISTLSGDLNIQMTPHGTGKVQIDSELNVNQLATVSSLKMSGNKTTYAASVGIFLENPLTTLTSASGNPVTFNRIAQHQIDRTAINTPLSSATGLEIFGPPVSVLRTDSPITKSVALLISGGSAEINNTAESTRAYGLICKNPVQGVNKIAIHTTNMSVGASYEDIVPPTNGMIVEGNLFVGFSAASPHSDQITQKMAINGSTDLYRGRLYVQGRVGEEGLTTMQTYGEDNAVNATQGALVVVGSIVTRDQGSIRSDGTLYIKGVSTFLEKATFTDPSDGGNPVIANTERISVPHGFISTKKLKVDANLELYTFTDGPVNKHSIVKANNDYELRLQSGTDKRIYFESDVVMSNIWAGANVIFGEPDDTTYIVINGNKITTNDSGVDLLIESKSASSIYLDKVVVKGYQISTADNSAPLYFNPALGIRIMDFEILAATDDRATIKTYTNDKSIKLSPNGTGTTEIMNGGLTVNGTLTMAGGSSISANAISAQSVSAVNLSSSGATTANSLTIGSSGQLQINNVGTIIAPTINTNVNISTSGTGRLVVSNGQTITSGSLILSNGGITVTNGSIQTTTGAIVGKSMNIGDSPVLNVTTAGVITAADNVNVAITTTGTGKLLVTGNSQTTGTCQAGSFVIQNGSSQNIFAVSSSGTTSTLSLIDPAGIGNTVFITGNASGESMILSNLSIGTSSNPSGRKLLVNGSVGATTINVGNITLGTNTISTSSGALTLTSNTSTVNVTNTLTVGDFTLSGNTISSSSVNTNMGRVRFAFDAANTYRDLSITDPCQSGAPAFFGRISLFPSSTIGYYIGTCTADGFGVAKDNLTGNDPDVIMAYTKVTSREALRTTSLFLNTASSNSDGVLGINCTNTVATAALQVDSTTKGFLMPRMDTTARNLISSPASGLQVYDTTLNTICTYNGTNWYFTTFARFRLFADYSTQGIIKWTSATTYTSSGISYTSSGANEGRFTLVNVGSYRIFCSATFQLVTSSNTERAVILQFKLVTGDVIYSQANDTLPVSEANNKYGCAVIADILTTTVENTEVYFSFTTLDHADGRLDDTTHGFIERIN